MDEYSGRVVVPVSTTLVAAREIATADWMIIETKTISN